MILYHGSNLIVEEPMIVKTKYTKDFGWGFYTTENRTQAEQWARRKAQEGALPRDIFLQLATFQHPTQQTSFHTARALAALTFLEGTTL